MEVVGYAQRRGALLPSSTPPSLCVLRRQVYRALAKNKTVSVTGSSGGNMLADVLASQEQVLPPPFPPTAGQSRLHDIAAPPSACLAVQYPCHFQRCSVYPVLELYDSPSAVPCLGRFS